jgi:hypothetical protein
MFRYPKVTVDAKGRVTSGAVLVAADIPAHSHTAGDVTSTLGYTPADRAGDHFTGPVDCGPHQTIGAPLENVAKFSEDFTDAAWDKSSGLCSVTSNAAIAPDGNQTADVVTASASTPVIQQQIAGLAGGETYTFYV